MKGRWKVDVANIILIIGGLTGLVSAIAMWAEKWRNAHSTERRDAVEGYAKLCAQLTARVDAQDARIESLECTLAITKVERDEARQRVVSLERRVSELEAELAKFTKAR